MIITVIEYGGAPRQIECESFEFRSNHVTNLIKIKKVDGTNEIIKDISVVKAEQQSCEDEYEEFKGDAISEIEKLPSVNLQPKTGHWIQTNEFFINQDGQFIYKFICSECKSLSYFRKSNKKAIGANVCPDCGAKMVEPQESKVQS